MLQMHCYSFHSPQASLGAQAFVLNRIHCSQAIVLRTETREQSPGCSQAALRAVGGRDAEQLHERMRVCGKGR